MYDKPDHVAMLRALDTALVEQARQWRTLLSACDAARETHGVDWTEEFCLVVCNRLAKLKKHRALAQCCELKPRQDPNAGEQPARWLRST